jgi:hypothetical protein
MQRSALIEDRARLVALYTRNVLTVLDARDDALTELLRERDVVGRQGTGVTERLARAGAVVDPKAYAGLVAVERELALRIIGELLLHREVRERLGELPELFVELARLVDRVDVGRVELGDAAPVLQRAVLAAERRLGPQPAELFVDAEEARAEVGLRRDERAEQLDQLLEERDERLLLVALAVERRESLRRDGRGRILVDRRHEVSRSVVRVSHGDRPDVRRLTQPVRGVCRIVGRHAHLLQQDRVRAGIRLPGLVGVAQCLFVVRVSHEALDEGLHLARVHSAARTLQWPSRAVHL